MEKKAYIIKTSKAGKGLFANKNFEKEEVILIPHGEILNKGQIEKKVNSKWFMDHSVQIDRDLYMGPANDAEDYVNHSCNPNAGHKIRKGKSKFIAIKNIKKGDEITFDYSTTMFNTNERMKCKCGSRSCRGHIKDFDKISKKIQNKYIKLGIVPEYITTLNKQ